MPLGLPRCKDSTRWSPSAVISYFPSGETPLLGILGNLRKEYLVGINRGNSKSTNIALYCLGLFFFSVGIGTSKIIPKWWNVLINVNLKDMCQNKK